MVTILKLLTDDNLKPTSQFRGQNETRKTVVDLVGDNYAQLN